MFARILLAALLLASSVASLPAFAQQTAPSTQAADKPLTPQQQALQAELNKVGPQLVSVATQIAELIDQNRAGDVWDNTSAITKALVGKSVFVAQINADRARLGAFKSRELSGLSSLVSDGRGDATANSPVMPAGTYINVAFAAQFAGSLRPVRELVSFHLDTDKRWHVTGYTVR